MHTRKEFYSSGKILLTGEYFVLDGAEAIAIPTSVGQTLQVRSEKSDQPQIHWKSFDHKKACWLNIALSADSFNLVKGELKSESIFLQKILGGAIELNPTFIPKGHNILIETHLQFPLSWGIGSSASLINNIAQWAQIDPFKLYSKVTNGSAVDLAASAASSPILYQIQGDKREIAPISLNSDVTRYFYFVHLNNKQCSQQEVDNYRNLPSPKSTLISRISKISQLIATTNNIALIENLMSEHEYIIGSHLHLPCIQQHYFNDFWGKAKSCGAWGGDFALITSTRSPAETVNYFRSKNFKVILPYQELISER